ncbi:MAG: lycopene cyclase domain-containing protein [Candidatus Heimdallarchaeota archaeon]
MLTYLDFLIYFIFLPFLGVFLINLFESRRKKGKKQILLGINPVVGLFILSAIALIYTTPWDNYLVATGVWFYELNQILGIIIGFVPVEEYTFFVVQPLLVGSIVIWGLNYYQPSSKQPKSGSLIRSIGFLTFFLPWILSLIIFILDFSNGTYLALIIVWFFPPILFQLGFGADILWRHRKLVLPAILIPSLYLSVVDAYAIFNGVWTIAPATSLGILIGGVLPLEELIFFFVTDILIVFGFILLMDVHSQERMRSLVTFLKNVLVYRFIDKEKGTVS